MAGEGGVGRCFEGREDAALLALDVALGDLEVFAGQLVREAEERLVLCSVFCEGGVPSTGGGDWRGSYEEQVALCIELRCRELRHVSKALRLGYLRSQVLRTENVEGG